MRADFVQKDEILSALDAIETDHFEKLFGGVERLFPLGGPEHVNNLIQGTREIVDALNTRLCDLKLPINVALDELDTKTHPDGLVVFCDGETRLVAMRFRKSVAFIKSEAMFVAHPDGLSMLVERIIAAVAEAVEDIANDLEVPGN